MALRFDDPSIVFNVNKGMILEASAGSGKTTILTERWIASFIYLLLWEKKSVSESLHAITALTFTRKAAMEMKVRIRERLENFWQDPEESKYLIQELSHFNGDCSMEWSELWAYLLSKKEEIDDLLSAAMITTINAYVLNQLRSHPIELGEDFMVSPEDGGKKISASEQEAQLLTLRSLLENKYPQHQESFTLAVQLLGMEQWQKLFSQLREFISKYGDKKIEESLYHSEYLLKNKSQCSSIDDVYRAIQDPVQTLIKCLESEQQQKPLVAGNDNLLDQLKNLDANNLITIFSKDMRQAYIFKALKNEDQNYYREQSQEAYQQLISKLYQIVMPMIWEISTLCSLEVQKIRDEKKEISFGDSENLFLEALSNPQFKAKIQSQTKFFFADEYQDTSDVQKDIFDLILSDPKIVPFFVGDPKQSIYSFRQANVYVFAQTVAEFEARDFEHKFLNKNYRSAKNHVELVNYLFDKIFDGDQTGIVYRPQESHSNELGEFICTTTMLEDEEGTKLKTDQVREYASYDAVALLDQKLKQGVSPGKIMVLFSNNDDILAFYQLVKEKFPTLPIASSFKNALWESEYLYPLLCFLRVIVNPHHDLTMVQLLKTAFFAYDDSKIVELLFKAKSLTCSLFSVLEENELSLINEFILLCDRVPLAELLTLLIQELEYENFLYQWTGLSEAVMSLHLALEEARKIQEKRNTSLGEFLDYIEKNSSGAEEAASIAQEGEVLRLMTVHASKGLESDHVIFIEKYSTGELKAKTPLFHQGQIMFDVLGVTELGEKLKDQSKVEKNSELKRLAYVAVTRAKKNFAICSVPSKYEKKDGVQTNWASFLNQELINENEDLSKMWLKTNLDKSLTKQEVTLPSRDKYHNRFDVLTDTSCLVQELPQYLSVSLLLDAEFNEKEFLDKYLRHSFDLETSLRAIGEEDFNLDFSYADVGQLVHEILQKFDSVPDQEVLKYLQVHHSEKEKIFDEVLDYVASYWASEFYQDLAHTSVHQDKERQVTLLLPNDIMIRATADLYVSQKDKHIIVDYKLSVGNNLERYQRQLSYYALLSERSGHTVDELVLYSLKDAQVYRFTWDKSQIENVFDKAVNKAISLLTQDKKEQTLF